MGSRAIAPPILNFFTIKKGKMYFMDGPFTNRKGAHLNYSIQLSIQILTELFETNLNFILSLPFQ
jgi:hypothetical protein